MAYFLPALGVEVEEFKAEWESGKREALSSAGAYSPGQQPWTTGAIKVGLGELKLGQVQNTDLSERLDPGRVGTAAPCSAPCSAPLRKRREWAPALAQLGHSWKGKQGPGWRALARRLTLPHQRRRWRRTTWPFRRGCAGAATVGSGSCSSRPARSERRRPASGLSGSPCSTARVRWRSFSSWAATATWLPLWHCRCSRQRPAAQRDAAVFLTGFSPRVVTGYDGCIPVIPVSSAAQLPSCLDSLRRQCAVPGPRADGQAVASRQRHLLAHCTTGSPLSEAQARVLSDVCTGFGHLAQHAVDARGQDRICYFLGRVDGEAPLQVFVWCVACC